MKIFYSIISIILLLGIPISPLVALTSNSNSTDLENSATENQDWSITDVSQTGLDFTGDLTFSMWVRLESPTVGTDGFISKRLAAGNNRSYDFLFDSSNIIQFVTWSDGITVACNFDIVWTPSANTWYHIGLIKLGASASVWVDGTQQGTNQSCTSATIVNGTADFSVGNRTENGVGLDGLIDDVRVWSRALSTTTSEFADLSDIPCDAANGTSLQGQWLFDEGTGTSANDETANNNDLTGNNTPGWSATTAYACAAVAGAPPSIIWFE